MKLTETLRKARLLLSGVKLSKLELSNKTTIQFDGDTLEKGASVYLEDASGEPLLAADGAYNLANGGTFVVKNGVVDTVTGSPAAVVPTEPVPQAQAAAPASPASPDVATETAPASNDIQSLLSALATALQPIQDSLNQVLNVLPGLCMMSKTVEATEKMAKETQLSLSQTIRVVEKIADEPSVVAPVKMSIEKPFIKEPPKDIKDSRAYQILHSK